MGVVRRGGRSTVVSQHKPHGRNRHDDGHMYQSWHMGGVFCMQELSALSQGYPAFLTMCRTAGLDLGLDMTDHPATPVLDDDMDPDLDPVTQAHHTRRYSRRSASFMAKAPKSSAPAVAAAAGDVLNACADCG